MLGELLEVLALREEKVALGGVELVVREMASVTDATGWVEGQTSYHLVVACTFAPDGTPAFTDEDIPALQRGSKAKLLPLIQAVLRVNGFDAAAEAKKSAAAPA